MSFKSAMNKVGFVLKKNSPYILFGLGMVGFGCTVAEAIHATTKTNKILNDRDEALKNVEEYYDDPESDEAKEEVREINRAARKDIAKTYVPTAILGASTLVCFGASFKIINDRYTGVTIALAATTEAFEKYRDRVREEENGDVKDYAYANGLDLEEVEETVIDEETGKKKKVKKMKAVGSPQGLYSYRFEQYDPSTETGATQWDNSSMSTIPYIHGVIEHRQRQLELGRRVWLSDILDDLGFGQNCFSGVERYAGWAPGDIILCGLEEVGASTSDPLSDDVMNFLYGYSSDVTLIFNPRPNLYDEVYGKNKEVAA